MPVTDPSRREPSRPTSSVEVDGLSLSLNHYRHVQIKLLFGLASIIIFGTLGYYLIEDHFSLFDAFYMVAISITTVGFGEIHDLSNAGRAFTVFLIFVGIGTSAALATNLARFLIEGEIQGVFRRRKMTKRIANICNHYIVCGHGRTGQTISLKLFERGLDFVVVDDDVDNLMLAEQRGFMTVKGSAGSDSVLLAAGVERAKGIVICLSNDAITLFVILAARELSPQIHIIAQGSDPSVESRMLRAGARKVVYPMRLGGEQIAKLIAGHVSGAESRLESGSAPCSVMGFTLETYRHFKTEPSTVAKATQRIGSCRVLALQRADGSVTENPSDDDVLNLDDTLVFARRGRAPGEPASQIRLQGIRWTDELCLGIFDIDDEHRALVRLVNRFIQTLKDGHSREESNSVFEHLLDYTSTHFRNEERLMRDAGYPLLPQHADEHRQLTAEVMQFNVHREVISQCNVGDFLVEWLTQHILRSDRQLADFLKQQRLSDRDPQEATRRQAAS